MSQRAALVTGPATVPPANDRSMESRCRIFATSGACGKTRISYEPRVPISATGSAGRLTGRGQPRKQPDFIARLRRAWSLGNGLGRCRIAQRKYNRVFPFYCSPSSAGLLFEICQLPGHHWHTHLTAPSMMQPELSPTVRESAV
jgi:hypothetical protein